MTDSRSLKGRMVSSTLWNMGSRIGQQGTQFATSIILAHLLGLADFGLIGMALVYSGFAGAFADAGLGAAIVQSPELDERHLDTVFWFSVGVSLFLTLLLMLLAPLMAQFYNRPDAVPIMRAISLVFVLAAPQITPIALLQRSMNFKRSAQISVAASISSSIIGIAFAFGGAGVWSLVFQYLSGSAISSVLSLIWTGWRPYFRFSVGAMRDLWGFSIHLMAFNIVNYPARNADNLLIGKYFGAAALGLYTRVYGLMLIPINQIISNVYGVLFSALSSVQHDKERAKHIFLRGVGLVSLISFPIMTGLMVTAQPFVLTIYGPKWAGIIPLLRILALAGMAQTLMSPTGPLYLSQGRADWMFRFGLVSSGVFVGSFVLGTALGSVRALTVCYTVANILLLYPWLRIPARLVDMAVLDIARVVAGPVLACVVMGCSVLGVEALVPGAWTAWRHLAVDSAVGVMVYGIAINALKVPAWKDLIAIAHDGLRSETRAPVEASESGVG